MYLTHYGVRIPESIVSGKKCQPFSQFTGKKVNLKNFKRTVDLSGDAPTVNQDLLSHLKKMANLN